MYVCMYVYNQLQKCYIADGLHSFTTCNTFLGVVFSVFAIKCYINVGVVWILQLKNKHKHAY